MTKMSWLDRSIHWRKTPDVFVPYAATSDSHTLELRLGDFPAEPLYNLLVDGVETLSLDPKWPDGWIRTTVLRDEDKGTDRRSLWAYIEKSGDFVIDGQDLGPSVERVFGRGIREYEWKRTVAARDVPRLGEVLGASAGSDVLEALGVWLSTHQPEELEKLIQDSDLSSTFWSRCGD